MTDERRKCFECGTTAEQVCHGIVPGEGGVHRSCQRPLCPSHVAGFQVVHLNYGDRRSGWYKQPLCRSCYDARQARIVEVQKRKAQRSDP